MLYNGWFFLAFKKWLAIQVYACLDKFGHGKLLFREGEPLEPNTSISPRDKMTLKMY